MMPTTANNHLVKLKAARMAYTWTYQGEHSQETCQGKGTRQQAAVPDQGGTCCAVKGRM